MAKEMSIKKRLLADTPKFFKNVIKVSLVLAAVGGALVTLDSIPQLNGFQLPVWIEKLSQWFIVGGVVATTVSKLTMDDNAQSYKAPNDQEQQNNG